MQQPGGNPLGCSRAEKWYTSNHPLVEGLWNMSAIPPGQISFQTIMALRPGNTSVETFIHDKLESYRQMLPRWPPRFLKFARAQNVRGCQAVHVRFGDNIRDQTKADAGFDVLSSNWSECALACHALNDEARARSNQRGKSERGVCFAPRPARRYSHLCPHGCKS